MVLRSAQEERAVRPYCAPSDGWPSNTTFGGLAAPFRGPRYGMRHAHAAFQAAWSAVHGQVRRRRSCGAEERAGRARGAAVHAISGFWTTWPRVRPLRWSLALVTVPTAPLGSRTCTYRRGTIYFNHPRAHSGYVTDRW